MTLDQPRHQDGQFGQKTGATPEVVLDAEETACAPRAYPALREAGCRGCGWVYRGDDAQSAADAHLTDPGFDEVTIESRRFGGPVQRFWKDGALHRVDGPAEREVGDAPGEGRWMFEGKEHRRGGPAECSRYSENDAWYVNGVKVELDAVDDATIDEGVDSVLYSAHYLAQELGADERSALNEAMTLAAKRAVLNERTRHL